MDDLSKQFELETGNEAYPDWNIANVNYASWLEGKIEMLQPIKTDEQHKKALFRLEEIFNNPEGTPEFNEAYILELLIEDYEAKYL